MTELRLGAESAVTTQSAPVYRHFGRRKEDGSILSPDVPSKTSGGEGEGIVAVIPAYNEERFIGSVVLKVRSHAATVIVVDDGSSDGTAQVASAAGALVVQLSQNQGKGAALNTGFRLAREYNPRAVVTLDADGQHLPEELAQVAGPILSGEADIVIGSRYLQRTSEVPRHRILGHWAFNLLTRVSSGVKATDSQSGFRAFSPAAIEKIDFRSAGFSVESEIQFIAHENGLRLVDVPITIRYTDRPKRPVLSQGLTVLNGVLKLTGQYRPMLFFGLVGGIVLAGGVFMGLDVANTFDRTHQLAVGHALISILLSMVGTLLLSTGFTLFSIRGLLVDMLSREERKR